MAECYSCKTILDFPQGKVSKDEECPKCRNDVKVCYNCTFFDQGSYNECRESMAERVTNKDKRNFCDYFKLSEDKSSNLSNNTKEKRQKQM